MALFANYETHHRVAFAFLLVGFALCITGAAVPFWHKAETWMTPGQVKTNLGLWVICFEDKYEHKCFDSDDFQYDNGGYDSDDDDLYYGSDDYYDIDYIQVSRLLVSAQLCLSFIAIIIAFVKCVSCASTGTRSVIHGTVSLLGGACGFGGVGVMAAKRSSLVEVRVGEMSYDWGFFVYIAGCGTMVLVSLFLCICMPNETRNAGSTVFTTPVSGDSVAVSSNNAFGPYQVSGRIEYFEPLPGFPKHLPGYPPAYNSLYAPSFPAQSPDGPPAYKPMA